MSTPPGGPTDPADARDDLVHEFRNHLTVIVGYCDLLMRQLPEADPRRADVAQMHDAGHAALALLPKLSARER